MVLSWLTSKLLGFALRRLSAGDPRVVLGLDADDVQLTFPGRNSFSGVYSGKPAVRRWLQRFAAIGMQIEPRETVAVGPPWKTTVCVLVHVWLPDPAGGVVYDNTGVIWGHLVWGKLRRYEVFEDPEPANAIDTWLAEKRPELAPSVLAN